MKTIRLCFQVFLKGTAENVYNIPLAPVVSEPIQNKDAMCDLKIVKLSKPSCSVVGGDDIILLCEKVSTAESFKCGEMIKCGFDLNFNVFIFNEKGGERRHQNSFF